MIKNVKMRISVDNRGKISTGRKNPETGYPQSLDHFDITDFQELVSVYGDKPDKIVVVFPTDEVSDFFDCNYMLYGKQKGDAVLKRRCDGEECIHRIKETVGGKTYEQGEFSSCVCSDLPEMIEDDKHPGKEKPNPERCKYGAWLKAFVLNPHTKKIENPNCYFFETHSKNSGDAVLSEIEKIKALNMGVIRGIPFILSVKMVSGKTSATQKFPIWNLQVVGMLSEIREKNLMIAEVDEPKQLSGIVDAPISLLEAKELKKKMSEVKSKITEQQVFAVMMKRYAHNEIDRLTHETFSDLMKQLDFWYNREYIEVDVILPYKN